MKIALITLNVVKNDGQGRVNYEIARYLSGHRHDVHLYVNRVDQNLVDAQGITVHHIPVLNVTSLIKGVSFALLVWLVIRRHKFDIIHNNGDAAFIASDVNTCHMCHSASPLDRFVSKRRSLRSSYKMLYRRFHARVERYVYRNSRIVIAVSRKVERELMVFVGIPQDKIALIRNGVDSDEYAIKRPDAADHGKAGTRGLRLLFVGDLSSRMKGLDTVLEALTYVPDEVTLSVVGCTSSSTYPQTVAAVATLAQRVRFLGFRHDMPAVYQDHDVLVFPSHYDACGLVPLEAMASGLAVIVSACAGTSELIVHGVNGFILEDPHDTSALACYIVQLHDDTLRRESLGRRAREAAVAHSWQQMGRRVESLYESLHHGRVGDVALLSNKDDGGRR